MDAENVGEIDDDVEESDDDDDDRDENISMEDFFSLFINASVWVLVGLNENSFNLSLVLMVELLVVLDGLLR